MGGGRRRTVGVLVALGVAVIVLGELSIRAAPAGSHVAAWWPAAGLSVATGLRMGRDRLAAVVTVTWVASVVANALGGRELIVALLFSTTNAVEVVVVCLLVQAWTPERSLAEVRDVARSAAAVVVGAAVAGIGAASAVHWRLGGDVWTTAQAVACSHASAVLLMLPFGLVARGAPRRARPGESVVMAGCLVAVTLTVFGPNQSLPLVFLLFPVLVIGAFRHPLTTNAAFLLVVSAVASFACARHWGPLIAAVEASTLPPETTGTMLQALMVTAAIMTYAVCVTVESRAAALGDARHATAHLEAVLRSAPSTSIIQTDLVGVIQVFNQGAENLLGYSSEEIVGHATPAAFHDPTEVARRAEELGVEPGFEVFVHDVKHGGGQSERRDWTYVAKSGRRRQVSLVVSRVDDAAGRAIGYLGIAEDVGAQRQVEKLLVQALEHERALAARLRAADDMKDEFVSSVSHELRTPMTSVLGYAEILREGFGDVLDGQGLDILARIESNGNRLLGLVDNLLTLSRLGSTPLELERSPLDVTTAARNALTVLEPLAHDRGVALVVRTPQEALHVEGNTFELERALTNVLGNALKFTPAGGTVTVECLRHEASVLLVVSDTGAGIPPDELTKVFERFHRASNAASRATPGTGLGLAIVKAIVERHRGEVRLSSELGHGTTCTITLPASSPVLTSLEMA